MTVADAAEAGKRPSEVRNSNRIRIYQHSDLMYWWVVWLYGFFCAGLTYLEGNKVTIGSQDLLLYPRSWLGVSMILLILFVAIFTNVKARGVYSITLLLAVGLIAAIVQLTYGWDKIVIYFPLLRVHMNLAFFVMLPSILCFVCVV